MKSGRLPGRRVVVVDGCRTPFLRSGTDFLDLSAYDLGRAAVAGLLHRNPIDPKQVDALVMGTVISDPDTSNVAREVGLASGLPSSCPAYTLTVACVSANLAFVNAAHFIASGMADVVIAGGTETLSDAPIRLSRPMRKRLMGAQRVKGPLGLLRHFAGAKLRDLKPAVPAIADFSTGLSMGQNGERLAKRLGVTRADQDAYALSSHLRAAKARQEGRLGRQIVPVLVPGRFRIVREDNGIRGDSTPEKMGSLKPAFDRSFGSLTAANSSYLTDGASAVLLMSEEKARELKVRPLASLVSYGFTAMDPLDELLLGPAFAIPQALDGAGLTLDQMGVVEIHEAFAAQMVANLKLLESDSFARERLGRDRAVGRVDPERLNAWGGSLSIGHPFGATGGRLVTTCVQRMQEEGARYGLVAACAAGAVGNALVFERVEP
ncbi:MAG: acetyl-CoA C-acyltransferase [Acidobacteriota bacterium]